MLGWMLMAWAALRLPNGANVFLIVVGLFLLLHVVIPALRQLGQLPSKPRPEPPAADRGVAPAVASLVIGGLLWFSLPNAVDARAAHVECNATTFCELCPEGITENSPAFQRRVGVGETSVPKGRLKRSLQSSLRDSVRVLGRVPGVETPGYFQTSLRDKRIEKQVVMDLPSSVP